MKLFKTALIIVTILLVSCSTNTSSLDNIHTGYQQEITKSKEWISAWDTCSGNIAFKNDGSLWQFGKVGGCNWGQILPIDMKTGKPIYEKNYIYHLDPKKLADGFHGAKVINGGYRVYVIKRDGTLWGWGEGLGVKPSKLNSSSNWSDFAIKYEGNGCCSFDVGLKNDGTLWRFSEATFTHKYSTANSTLKIQKISRFSDWKKIILGCCSIYGLRKDHSLWKSYEEDNKTVFKRYQLRNKSYDVDHEMYPYLMFKMKKVPLGTIYSPIHSRESTKVNQDGTLFLLPEIVYK